MDSYPPSVRLIIDVLQEKQPIPINDLGNECGKRGLSAGWVSPFGAAIDWMKERKMLAYQNGCYLRLADFYGDKADEYERKAK